MNRQIDIYCERLAPGLWAEPLNLVTNLAFVLAGLMLIVVLRRQDAVVREDPVMIGLTLLVVIIGIGSSLWHSFAVVWAGLADVTPIAIFILLYMYLALKRFAAFPLWACLLGVAVVLALVTVMPAVFGFSVSTYGVALAAMLGIGGFLHLARRHPAGLPIFTTGVIFAVSLSFRTADLPLCDRFSIGTHFVWHLMNAVVLYRLTRTMMRFGRRPVVAPG